MSDDAAKIEILAATRALTDPSYAKDPVAQMASPAATEGAVMSNPTREEIDAKLATVEARTEARFIELSGKIDRVADSINNLTSVVTAIRAEVKEDYKFTRWTIGVTLVASLIAFTAALWVTQGNLLAAFQSGIAVRSEINAPPAPT
jgi:hypothetical protein